MQLIELSGFSKPMSIGLILLLLFSLTVVSSSNAVLLTFGKPSIFRNESGENNDPRISHNFIFLPFSLAIRAVNMLNISIKSAEMNSVVSFYIIILLW